MIKGETVILLDRIKTGTDPFGKDTFTETEIAVNDVIVGTPSDDAVVTELSLSGRKMAYVLGIPKSDNHEWADRTVVIRGNKFRTYGTPLTQTPANVPLRWNTQVKVERYE